jgi:hypothetical protein
VAEVGQTDDDLGYDRTESDPVLLATLLDVAAQVARTEANCIGAAETAVVDVRTNHEPAQLPVPAATVECESIDEENLTFEAFDSEDAKQVFLAAKRELLCVRGKRAGTDPTSGLSSFDGLPYVDGGAWIIEPDSTGMRDRIAQALGVAAGQMCDNIDPNIDPVPGVAL